LTVAAYDCESDNEDFLQFVQIICHSTDEQDREVLTDWPSRCKIDCDIDCDAAGAPDSACYYGCYADCRECEPWTDMKQCT
jgi:hypothetical protein